MTFVAQLDLAAIAPFDPRGLLPKRGMLAFFVGELDQGAVIYSDDPKTLVPAKVPAGVKFAGAPAPTFPACGVRLRGAVSLPLEIADDKGRWFDVFDGHREAPHRVLGHPFGEPEGMDDDEVVLLALGSDDSCGMEWGDARTLYFCIHPTSLAGGAWSRVRVVSGT